MKLKQELENMRSEMAVLKEKSSLSSESLSQATKRAQSTQAVLSEKIGEVRDEVGCDL